MHCLLSGNLEMMSDSDALILYVLSPSSSCFCPSRSKHHRLKAAGAALILLGACELSMSFSLDSLKGSLSFPLGFDCLLAASSAGQITARYLHFECIWEGPPCPAPSSTPPQEGEKCYLHPRGGRSQTEGRQERCMYVSAFHLQWDLVLEFLFYNWGENAALDVLWEELVAGQIILKIHHDPLFICGVLKWSGRWLKAIVCGVKVLVDSTLMCSEVEEGSLWDCARGWVWDMTALMDFFVWKFKCLLKPSHV